MLFEVISTSSRELIQELTEIQEQSIDPVECLKKMLLAHMVHFSLKRKEETQILAADNHLLRGKRRLTCRKIQREIYDIYRNQLQAIAGHGLMNNVDQFVLLMVSGRRTSVKGGGRPKHPGFYFSRHTQAMKNILTIRNRQFVDIASLRYI
jgi:hypothetical protein